MAEDDEQGYGLVMPFVSVASNGGPHDDVAYTAGWEMGALDAELAHARPDVLDRTIHTENTAQADLVAMKHGYHVNCYELGDGWSSLKLSRTAGAHREEAS